jgi:hypothetical protein
MFDWLNGEGAALRHHIPGTTNYVSDLQDRNNAARVKGGGSAAEAGDAGETEEGLGGNKPFPLNQQFVSEPILSEKLRNEIYERVVVQKKSVRAVSVELHVDMRRVGAVVRLVEMERRWRGQVSCIKSSAFLILCPTVAMMSKISISLEDSSYSQPENGYFNNKITTL